MFDSKQRSRCDANTFPASYRNCSFFVRARARQIQQQQIESISITNPRYLLLTLPAPRPITAKTTSFANMAKNAIFQTNNFNLDQEILKLFNTQTANLATNLSTFIPTYQAQGAFFPLLPLPGVAERYQLKWYCSMLILLKAGKGNINWLSFYPTIILTYTS